MSSIPNIPTKFKEGCSLIYLIDENQCVAHSRDTINNNISSLSSNLLNLENYAQYWNTAYSTFLSNSASWLIASSHIQQYNKLWSGTYTTVNALSASWYTPFTLYYPQIVLIDTWYSNPAAYTGKLIPDWLTTNFPPLKYAPSQIVYIQVNLYQQQPFSFSFSRSLWEGCAPQGGASFVCNQECGDRPNRGCNHHDEHAGWGACDNAFDHCGVSVRALNSSFSCGSSGGRQLQINKNLTSVDTSVARILKFTYKNINNTWSLI